MEKNLKKGLPLTYLPKLGADLVTALTGLDVDEFTHFEEVFLTTKLSSYSSPVSVIVIRH